MPQEMLDNLGHLVEVMMALQALEGTKSELVTEAACAMLRPSEALLQQL
eukprot:COSAG02_NODE_9858_length_2090_cov_1.909091_2_plen_49_part_00